MAAVRQALADNLSTISGIQVSAYVLSNPTPPAIQVVPGPAEYHQTMGASSASWWDFTIQAYVAVATDIGSQARLDRLLADDGAESVRAALESDTTLGGLCDDLIVVSRTGYTLFAPEGRGSVLGAEWTVRVFT